MRQLLAAFAVSVLLFAMPATGHAAAPAVRIEPGESVASALEKYRSEGIRIVYTTGLVPDRFRVVETPDRTAPVEDQLRELLAPFGLTVTRGADDIWVVVAGSEVPSEPAPVVAPTAAAVEPVIEEVLVTASHHRLLRTPTPTQVLGSRELDNTPSAGRDLFRAVTSLPGQATDGLSARQKIRGGNENEVLYVLDGTQLIAPFHMDGFFSPFSALNTNVVDAVDVYNAGYPTRFGTRSGGVLDLTIRDTDEAFSGSVDLNLLRASVHAQGARDNWQWLGSLRQGTVHYVLRQLNNDYGEPEFHDEMLRLQRETGSSRITFGVMNSGDQILLRNPAIQEVGRAHRDNLTVWGLGELFPDARTRLSSRASYVRVDNSRSGTLDNPVDAVGSVDESDQVQIYRLSVEVNRTLSKRFGLTGGIEYQHHEGSFEGYLRSEYGPLGLPIQPSSTLDRAFDTTRKGEMGSAYASLSARLTDSLEAELGLRYDNQDIDPVHDDRWSPRLQANYRPNDRVSLFLNVGRYVQHQYLFEIPLDDGLFELAPPQLVDQISLGMELKLNPSLELLVESYGKRIRDPQPRPDNLYNRYVLLPEIHGDRVLLLPDRARASGLEVSLAGRAARALAWRLGYVYADVSERFEGVWRPRPWDQHHSFRAQIGWEGERWQASVLATYHQGWATTSLITEPGATASDYNDTRLKDFVSIDLSVARTWQFQRGSLEAYLQISNLLNRTNVGGVNYDLEDGLWEGDPRTLLPILPVLGLKYSW
jgi:hypothetical protein